MYTNDSVFNVIGVRDLYLKMDNILLSEHLLKVKSQT